MKINLSGNIDLSKNRLPDPGWVYLMQDLNTGLYKIGHTKALWARYTAIKNINAGPIRLIARMKGTPQDEEAARELFGEFHHSEWVTISKEMLPNVFLFFKGVKMIISEKTERDQRFIDNLLNDNRAAQILLTRHGLLQEYGIERQKIFDAEGRETEHQARREAKHKHDEPHMDLSKESIGIPAWPQRRD